MVESKNTLDMLGRSGLIPVAQAQNILLRQLEKIRTVVEEIPLEDSLDRVIAFDISSSEDLPAHPRSTMDGYAVRAADTFGASESMPGYLTISGEVLMGEVAVGEVKKGCCFKVPTGGLIPAGADSVVMLEHTVPVDETMIEVIKGVGSGTNLIQRGEDIQLDALALSAGHRLRAQDIGLLAGLGVSSVQVFSKVRVGILSTGDEIIDHRNVPAPGQIRNINSIALGCLVQKENGIYTDYGIVADNLDTFLSAVEKAVNENDIVLFSGGSSVGVRDLGEQVVEALGPPGPLVHGVTLKPGKPVLIGMSGDCPLFGLPGHPVSAMVCFDFFVRPAMETLSGINTDFEQPIPSVTARLNRNINSAAGRLDVVRVKILQEEDHWIAEPILGKSGSISTLSRSHGYFLIEEDSQGALENSEIQVYLFR
jgi:molybdopterin molybdotransferase